MIDQPPIEEVGDDVRSPALQTIYVDTCVQQQPLSRLGAVAKKG